MEYKGVLEGQQGSTVGTGIHSAPTCRKLGEYSEEIC